MDIEKNKREFKKIKRFGKGAGSVHKVTKSEIESKINSKKAFVELFSL